jgi:hypothetical protein
MAVNINLSNRKLELIQWLSTIEDPKIIGGIQFLKMKEKQLIQELMMPTL